MFGNGNDDGHNKIENHHWIIGEQNDIENNAEVRGIWIAQMCIDFMVNKSFNVMKIFYAILSFMSQYLISVMILLTFIFFWISIFSSLIFWIFILFLFDFWNHYFKFKADRNEYTVLIGNIIAKKSEFSRWRLTLQSFGSKVNVYWMTPVGTILILWIIHLCLSISETSQNLPSTT